MAGKYRVEVTDDCIGCGACEAACPAEFAVKDGKAHAKKAELAELGCAKDAADVCPVNAIHITDLAQKKKLI